MEKKIRKTKIQLRSHQRSSTCVVLNPPLKSLHNTNQIKSPKGPSKFHHHKLISLPTKNHHNRAQKELKKEENPPPPPSPSPPPPPISEVLFSESSMAASISVNGFKGGWSSANRGSRGTSMWGEDYATLAPTRVRVGKKPTRLVPMMKNVNEGKGVFAPIVVVTRNIIGRKTFNQLRGKAIALHSQVHCPPLSYGFSFHAFVTQ